MADDSDTRTTGATIAIIVIASLACAYTLYFARSFLVPIAFAILLDFLFSPLVRGMQKLYIPASAGAAIIVIGLIAVAAFGSYTLSGPAQKMLRDAPTTIARVRSKVDKVVRPLTEATSTASKAAKEVAVMSDSTSPAEVTVVGPSVASQLAETVQRMLAAVFQVAFLLFFLLAGGDLFLEKTIRVIPVLQDKKKAVRIARDVESAVSVYLIANLGINFMAGVMVTAAMWFLEMPNPVLWGVLTVALEFIPFVGPLALMGLLTVSALGVYDSVGQILLVPGAYFVVNLIQGNIVTTLVLGRRLALNSVALFIGLAFWFWVWGVAGAFIGVPLMSIIKICCDHIEVLHPIGEFLGARDEPARAAALPDASTA
ncbi:AI-2E family transporter [Gemmatimonas sp.]|uniref:AI-2E family transporter n=1 Tax=Gemmatimonas sp. TaxID=1962908 RepID=UPI0039834056